MSPSLDQTALHPRKSARQARSAATVEVIVEAAARILETAGLAGYTTNAVADRAGVSVGSLYQYFPNKDAITRALIRRELEALERAIAAIATAPGPEPLRRIVEVAVDQQMHRPALARLLELEEERLGASDDSDPVRGRVANALSAIFTASGHPSGREIVQDVMMVTAALVNAAASRGERDRPRLVNRIEAVLQTRLIVG